MKSKNAKSKTAPKQKLGFLLTLTLVWLCLGSFYQLLGLLTGTAAMIASFRGELPISVGLQAFLLGIAILALFLVTIYFLLKGYRAFFFTLAACQLLNMYVNVAKTTLGNKFVLFIGGLVLYAVFYLLLFVSDNVRKRFGMPILHPRKKKPENTWS